MKTSKKENIIIVIVCTLYLTVVIGLLIIMSKIDKQTEETTTFYTATVNSVDVNDTGKDIFAEIHVKEYSQYLLITPEICENINMDDVKKLTKGQTIFFGIENITAQQMKEFAFVDITSLRTETIDILTLDEYNQITHNAALPAKITGIVVASLLFFVSLFYFLKIKRKTQHTQ